MAPNPRPEPTGKTPAPSQGEPIEPGSRRRFRGRRIVLATAAALLTVVVVSDLLGWSYLRQPAQWMASRALEREVRIDAPLALHLLRREPSLNVGGLHVAAPSWSDEPHFVELRDIALRLDWRFLGGQPPRFTHIGLGRGDIRAIRASDGRATWDIGQASPPSEAAQTSGMPIPRIGTLDIGALDVKFVDQTRELTTAGTVRTEVTHDDATLHVDAKGAWQKNPFGFEITAPRVLEMTGSGEARDLVVNGQIRSTRLHFEGSVADIHGVNGLDGTIAVNGSTLGDLSIVPGVVLPDTPPFRLEARLQSKDRQLSGQVSRAEIGSSRMTAEFTYAGEQSPPMLTGRLDASRLVLQDLGPAIGTGGGSAKGKPSGAGSSGTKAGASGSGRSGEKPGEKVGEKAGTTSADKPAGRVVEREPGGNLAVQRETSPSEPPAANRVLPDQPFDVPGLKAMNADFGIDLRQLDLGTDALRPLTAVKTRLRLTDGVIDLSDLEAELAGGRVKGRTSLDARDEKAAPAWEADLDWRRVNLQRWIRSGDAFVLAGGFSGKTAVHARGKSTAALLRSLDGSIRGQIEGGSISHLILEAVGLDVAQAIGVYFKGSEPLKLSCALVDIRADKGRLTANTLVLNTADTVIFVDGGVDLRNEALALRIVPTPKDWSPFSLRAPIRVDGTLGQPSVSVEATPIALRVLAGIVLGAAAAPAAAVVPFIDPGDDKIGEGCSAAIADVRERAKGFDPKALEKKDAKPAAPLPGGLMRHPGMRP